MDELAYAAKMDPVAFFRQNVTHENRPDRPWFHDYRWLAIIESSAKMAKWEPRVAASRLTDGPIATGRGIAVQHTLLHDLRGRRLNRGQQADREDHRQGSLRHAGHRPEHQPGAR
jgi:hypothetical protein